MLAILDHRYSAVFKILRKRMHDARKTFARFTQTAVHKHILNTL